MTFFEMSIQNFGKSNRRRHLIYFGSVIIAVFRSLYDALVLITRTDSILGRARINTRQSLVCWKELESAIQLENRQGFSVS